MNAQLDLFDNSPIRVEPVSQTLTITKRTIAAIEKFQDDICAALDYADGTHTFDDVVQMIFSGKVIFWPMQKSFYITEIHAYPQKRVMHVFLSGGDLDEILANIHVIRGMAKNANCGAMSLCGRPGWQKVLSTRGWKPSGTMLSCEVYPNE